jgi:AAA family ATP:ADP antiporter
MSSSYASFEQKAGWRRISGWLQVRSGEGSTVLYLCLVSLLIGLGLAVGRSTSDSLFLIQYGPQYLPAVFVGSGVWLALSSLMYAEYVDRIRPWQMLAGLLGLTGAGVGGLWLAIAAEGGRWIFAVYIVLYGAASEMMLMQLNLYVTGHFDALAAKRLIPLTNASSRLGAVAGGLGVGLLGQHIETSYLILGWSVAFLIGVFAILFRHKSDKVPSFARMRHRAKGSHGLIEGVRYAKRSRLLRIIGIGLFILIMLLSIQDFVANTLIASHFQNNEAGLTSFLGWLLAAVNGSVLVAQTFFTGRIIHRIGVTGANLIFPITTLLGFIGLGAWPGFMSAIAARINTSGILNAFRNPTAALFFNALPEHIQGRARALTTGLLLPLGLVVGGSLLLIIPRENILPAVILGLVLSAAFLVVKLRKGQAYVESLFSLMDEMVFTRNAKLIADSGRMDKRSTERLVEYLSNASVEEGQTIIEALAQGDPQTTEELVPDAFASLPAATRDVLLYKMSAVDFPGWQAIAQGQLKDQDAHLQITALRTLIESSDETAIRQAHLWLDSPSPRIRSGAAGALLATGRDEDHHARSILAKMITSTDSSERLSALQASRDSHCPDLLAQVESCTTSTEARERALALESAICLRAESGQSCVSHVDAMLSDTSAEVRRTLARYAHNIKDEDLCLKVLAGLLKDDDFNVRRAALDNANRLAPQTEEGWSRAFELYERDFDLLSVVLKALGASSLPGNKKLLDQLAQKHLDLARELRQIYHRIVGSKKGNSTLDVDFMHEVLNEEIGRHAILALDAMEASAKDPVLSVIRSGLVSKDRKVRASALEAARFYKSDSVMEHLARFLESEFDTDIKHTRSGTDWHTQIHELLTKGSPWLRECAELALSSVEEKKDTVA